MQFNASSCCLTSMSGHTDAFVDSKGHSQVRRPTLRSWREVKTELDQILTTTMTENDPQSGFGSRSLSDVEERFREIRKHLDTLFQIVGSLEEQLEMTQRQNTTLTLSLIHI